MRNLVCRGCDEIVSVFEAAHGARTDAEHEFVDAATFACADCLTPIPGGDPVVVRPSDSRAGSQAGLNGSSGSPTSPSGPELEPCLVPGRMLRDDEPIPF